MISDVLDMFAYDGVTKGSYFSGAPRHYNERSCQRIFFWLLMTMVIDRDRLKVDQVHL